MSLHAPRSTGRPVPYSDEELLQVGPPAPMTGENLREIAFPLGGLGTGCLALSGSGQLVDWEIFNRPNKGWRPDNTYFVLFAQAEGAEPTFRVMEGRLQPPYQGYQKGAEQYRGFGFGPPREFGSGFVRFQDCTFTGRFPCAQVDLQDPESPVAVSMEAWSPFIPLDDANSSFPVAIFDITLTNTTDKPVRSTVALGLQNVVGWPEVGRGLTSFVEEEGYCGLLMTTQKHEEDSPRFGSMALLTPTEGPAEEAVTYQLRFAETSWFAQTEGLMDDFGTTGEFKGPRDLQLSGDNAASTAHLGLKVSLAPGESCTRTLVLAWLMPNFEKYWGPGAGTTWKTYQATRWESAQEVAAEVLYNLGTLRDRTRRFADTFFSSTLPTYVLDAISTQASILRSPTVTRLTDGTLYGWEGCHCNAGCCEGSCTHVWTYAQTLAYLFPQLERAMRDVDFAYDLRDSDGHMQFRMPLPPGTYADHKFHAAADGQMGNVLRVYREWQICGKDEWLQKLWPGVKKALEYAWTDWDKDRDGLLEGVHHNTLDIEYHGPETVCGSMYLAALRAAEEMARHLGDTEAAEKYRRVFESGSRLSDEKLYDGEYYVQRIPEGSELPYQYGPGCICDQVLGQWHARMYGLGDLYDPEHVRSAIASVYRHNFRDDFFSHNNPHRVYALNDDRGLLICTWPKGGRPRRSVTYAFECMIGFEYQVGAHLIYEGFLREGLTVCKAVRDRHDGLKRNPFNEFECGSHYARSMANYAFLLALSGFRYSAPERTLHLEPRLFAEDFHCFFSVEGAWGLVHHCRGSEGPQVEVEVLEGSLKLDRVVVQEVELSTTAWKVK
ncbi:MAG: GH116 family glycosyl-hydrolase [Armatimonadia bacterium]